MNSTQPSGPAWSRAAGRLKALLAALAGLASSVWDSLGQEAPANPPGALSNSMLPDAGVSLMRVSGALALVVGIFLAGVWLFKNWQRLLLKSKGTPKLDLIEVRPLGGRHALYLIGYDTQRMLLAASPSGIQFITHLPDADLDRAPATPVFSTVLDDTKPPGTQAARREAS